MRNTISINTRNLKRSIVEKHFKHATIIPRKIYENRMKKIQEFWIECALFGFVLSFTDFFSGQLSVMNEVKCLFLLSFSIIKVFD